MATAISSSSSPWAKPGAWALDSEQHEEELKQQQPPSPPSTDFPSLSAAVSTTSSKPKKKSKQTLSLAEFSNYKPPSFNSTSVVPDVVLPTGPRERTAEEIAEARRGGFRNYGGDRDRDRERERPGFGGGDRDMGPSRADESGDWGKGKKAFGPGSGPDRDSGPSRADEVDDWSKGKKFGSGFGEVRGERREKVGFFNSSRADEADNWGAKKGVGVGSGSSFGEDRRRERRVGFEATGPGRDVDSWVKGKENGSGGGGGRPRLNLQPRTLPIEEVVVKVESNGNDVVNGDGNVSGEEEKEKEVVVKVKSNPFGAARPREEVLKEKGKDWKEIDEKLESVKVNEVKEVERSSFDSIGKRRGFGGGDGKSVGAWRKPDSPSYANVVAIAAAASTTIAPQSGDTIEKNGEPGTTEKAPEDN